MKVGAIRDCYKKLKDDNIPKKENKKWTEVDKAKLTKVMSDHVELADTALAVKKNNHCQRSRSRCWLPCLRKGRTSCN